MKLAEIELTYLRELAITALINRGAQEQEAAIVYEDYLDAELRGRSSHGFSSFTVALEAFPQTEHYSVEHKTDSSLTIDGRGSCGHLVARKAIDIAIKDLPEKNRVLGIRNITRFNCPGPLARYAAEKGYLAVVLEYGGANFMIPHGGKKAALSTNPIAIAIPGSDPLFVMDIATSERAIGFISLARMMGESIPDTWGVDKDGIATEDPHAVKAVRPFGSYKGFALSLAFEIMSGVLVGTPIGSRGTLTNRGALIWLLDPTIFGVSKEAFSSKLNEFLNEIQDTEAINRTCPVSYPGQKSQERVKAALKKGSIFLPEKVVEELSLAAQ